MTAIQSAVHRRQILTGRECREARAGLETVRSHWIPRAPANCYTVGRASYIDVSASGGAQPRYFADAPAYNSILRDTFGNLLEAVRREIESVTGETAYLTPRFGLPGFHIFVGPAIQQAARRTPHFDMQFSLLPWDGLRDRDVQPLSFTLPVTLPRQGAGLRIWDVTEERFAALKREQAMTLGRVMTEVPNQVINYTEGEVVIVRSLLLHRIEQTTPVQADDERITLQGHAVRLQGRWELYW